MVTARAHVLTAIDGHADVAVQVHGATRVAVTIDGQARGVPAGDLPPPPDPWLRDQAAAILEDATGQALIEAGM